MSIKHTHPHLLLPSSLPLHIRLHRLGSYWHTACGVLFCVSLSRAHACNPLAALAPKCSQMRPRDAMPAFCMYVCVCARCVNVVHALAVPHPTPRCPPPHPQASPVFAYRFTHDSGFDFPPLPACLGHACHTAELPYVFKSLVRQGGQSVG
jgi:hypothetical protein